MSGDCGHGWGFHVGGADGPCGLCLSNENATLRQRAERAEAGATSQYMEGFNAGKMFAELEAQSTIAELATTGLRLRIALSAILGHYVSLVNCGDCGNWNPETEKPVIDARAALGEP